MQTHRLNWRFHVITALVIGLLALGCYGFPVIFFGEAVDENGKSLGAEFTAVIGALLLVIFSSYLVSLIVTLRQCIIFKNVAFSVTEEGVENTLVCVNVFSFIFTLPIRRIPWDAVKSYTQDEENGFKLHLDTARVEAGLLARLLLRLTGFTFFYKLITPSMSESEIQRCKHMVDLYRH